MVGCVVNVEVKAEAYLNLNSFNFLHYTRIVILYLFFLSENTVLSVLSRKYLFKEAEIRNELRLSLLKKTQEARKSE